MKWIIIGISGLTCSGKTTIAKKIQETLEDSVLISQDNYFLSVDDPRHTLVPELNHLNWEILTSLDMSKMYSDVMKTISSLSSNNTLEDKTCSETKILILEGFLLFNYEPIADLCQLRYFLDLSREICWNRRSNRVYNPPDVPGYFDTVVWPEYLKHKEEIFSCPSLINSVKLLDGSKSIDELYNKIMSDINALLYKYFINKK
ncbi:nicotinamide riboside kinase 1 [Copidosoma floridanum]|uniref:nicotinamide riboside kinase 1 n=1 Tax=Copidosoma floridanum TaxID=29053 RepID=UPI0006C9BFB5|nr:nicotinamide riboside kinase 1 [Copidosoma floridanum]